MRTGILILLCCAFLGQVFAEGEHDVKRGVYPFMAIVYYPDETVVDGTGARFLRGAVLIRPNWLVSSAVGPSVTDNVPSGFPQKTMLARLGATAIDPKFSLNEDEDEQEREIIQIVRPYNNSATQWWLTDISLMKTLLPFNMTSAVGTTSLSFKTDFTDKICSILVYAKKFGSVNEDKVLTYLSVEMLPSSMDNCGSHFGGSTMACAADSDENKGITDADFCRGNSGGPLICDGQVTALQTYIENNCKPPHLYQLLSGWENFIQCGTQDNCHEENCAKTCDVVNKDTAVSESSKLNKATFVYVQTAEPSVTTSQAPEITNEEGEIVHIPTVTTITPGPVVTNISAKPMANTVSSVETTHVEEYDTTTSWPNEKHKEQSTKASDEAVERKTNVEAQYQQIEDVKVKQRNSAKRNVCFIDFVGIFVLTCLI